MVCVFICCGLCIYRIGYLTFNTVDEAEEARQQCKGNVLDGCHVKISFGREKQKQESEVKIKAAENTPPSCKLLVQDLAVEVTEDRLYGLFNTATDCYIVKSKETETSRGYVDINDFLI